MATQGDSDWSHVDERGKARMVDVSPKVASLRIARAEGTVRMAGATRRQITSQENPKGNVLDVARIAGIQGAKRTGALIPLCHPLAIENVRVDFSWVGGPEETEAGLRIEAEVKVTAKTGVEMEALTAVSIAALTVYDMAKAVDPGMVIEGIRLLEKTGGTSKR